MSSPEEPLWLCFVLLAGEKAFMLWVLTDLRKMLTETARPSRRMLRGPDSPSGPTCSELSKRRRKWTAERGSLWGCPFFLQKVCLSQKKSLLATQSNGWTLKTHEARLVLLSG